MVGRRSPPASSVSGTGASKQMLVRRSKSSAILPLRKHLIEKTLAEQQQKAVAAQQAAAQAAASVQQAAAASSTSFSSIESSAAASDKSLSIRPIEEVMEEDSFSRSGSMTNIMGHHQDSNAMEVDSIVEQQQVTVIAAAIRQ